jgi:hypothetical protein
MRQIQHIRWQWFLGLCLLVLSILLVACGASTGSSGGSGSGNNGGVTPTPTSGQGIGTANGCPSNAVANSQTPKANVTVRPGQMNQIITTHQGDTVEILLPFGNKWTGPMTSQGILQLQQPAGYASTADNSCVWRFTASGTGKQQLNFHSQALCKPGAICPMYITNVTFNIEVK